MPYRRNVFAPDQIYHVYNRGVNGMDIFARPENYRYLLRKVKRLLAELPIALLAYCLMPNHYHFVLRQESEVPISTFMQRLFQSYTQAFNKQQGRRGALCEGRFRHVHVDRDEYLVYLCRYVHLNPVAAGLVAQPSGPTAITWNGSRHGREPWWIVPSSASTSRRPRTTSLL